MANKKLLWGILALVLALGMVLVGCATKPEPESEETDIWSLDKILRKYMAPQEQTWDNNGVKDAQYTYVYFLDPLQFEEFRSELDAGGEYRQSDSWTDDNQDRIGGRTFARWAV
jgi:hypothetical protein